jgi:hypothetical protein
MHIEYVFLGNYSGCLLKFTYMAPLRIACTILFDGRRRQICELNMEAWQAYER